MSSGRRFAREYREFAHQRTRAELDKRLAKWDGAPPLQWQGPSDVQSASGKYSSRSRGQLSDQIFFARFSRARFCLRNVRPDDGLHDEKTALQVLVSHSRRGFQKTFIWRTGI